jgi:hypothetical protein
MVPVALSQTLAARDEESGSLVKATGEGRMVVSCDTGVTVRCFGERGMPGSPKFRVLRFEKANGRIIYKPSQQASWEWQRCSSSSNMQ